MSMPTFPNPKKFPSRDESITAIVTSIAMEEIALSHVINAESEKIKFIVECAKAQGCDNFNPEDLLAVNNSASEVLKSIVELQTILKEKLDIASQFSPMPPTPPLPPKPPCIPKFSTQAGLIWKKNNFLYLMGSDHCNGKNEPCNDGIKLVRKECQSQILLPQGKTFDIFFEFNAKNHSGFPTKIEAQFFHGKNIAKTELITHNDCKKISRRFSYKTPIGKAESYVSFKLIAPEILTCVTGVVTVNHIFVAK
ncbi:MAG: hypothetical protein FWF81_04750 [Defluviitaleaceae bacterium]|nr:hypothetical protein [Defluviitaleaceae bacterium]